MQRSKSCCPWFPKDGFEPLLLAEVTLFRQHTLR